jgi:hypothetical protein
LPKLTIVVTIVCSLSSHRLAPIWALAINCGVKVVSVVLQKRGLVFVRLTTVVFP